MCDKLFFFWDVQAIVVLNSTPKLFGIIVYTLVTMSGHSIYAIWDTIFSMEEDIKLFEGMIWSIMVDYTLKRKIRYFK